MIAFPAEVMVQVLKSVIPPLGQGVSTLDWFTVYGTLSTSPDNHLCVKDTTGIKYGRVMATGEEVIHEGIQIIVRGRTYALGIRKARNIRSVLAGLKNFAVTVGAETITLLSWSTAGSVNYVGQEEQNTRQLFTINGTVALRG